jgi:DNA-binding SARP family transcriptional activator
VRYGPPPFAVLGPLEVSGPDGGSLTPGGRKQRELLALLLLHRNRPLTADRLTEDLWGGAPPRGAEVTLRSHVSHLRRRLADADAGHAITTGPAGYTLVLASGQVDVERFEALVGLGQEAQGLGQPDRAAAHIRTALELWRGQPYADLPEVEAAVVEGTRLDEVHLVALETLIAAELDSGRHREVVGDLQQLVAAHPFRERFCAQLMVALYRSGRQADALAAFAATREKLAEELGLDPGQELRTLAQAILRQDPVVLGDVPPLPTKPSGRSVGHRPSSGPTDAVLSAAALVPLAGRVTESQRLGAAWSEVTQGGRRLVLLSGEAGIGKTRLAAGLVDVATTEGHLVLVGRCEAAGLPYHPLTAALRSSDEVQQARADAPVSVQSGLALLLDGPRGTADGNDAGPYDEQRLALYASVVHVLGRVADTGPVLLLIDSGERIDQASSLLLRHLVDRLPAAMAVVLCYRDPPGGRHPPLLELLGDGAALELTDRVALGPLTEPETFDLVRGVLPDADSALVRRIWQHTGGNPYYATEVARAFADRGHGDAALDGAPWEVPSGVREGLRHRLLPLGELARDVLAAAAVLGSEVDFDVLAAVVHADEEEVAMALDGVVAAGLLVESGRSWAGGYAFPHELTREAILRDVPGLKLRRLHLQAARALMSRPGLGNGGAAAVATHLHEAGPAADPGEAAEWSVRAAHEASALYAWDEAIAYADAAVDLLQRNGSSPLLAEVAVTAAALRLRSSRGFDRAVTLLESALREHVAAGNDAAAGTAHSRIGSALSLQHSVMDIPRALDHFEAAERLLREPTKSFYVSRGRAQAAMFGLRTELLKASGDRAVHLAAQILERMWGTAHELADPYLGWIPVNAAALVANAFVLDPAAARSWCRRGLSQPRFTTFAHSHETVVDQLGLALATMGELPAAREAVASLGPDAVACRVISFLDGDWEQAEEAWAAALVRDEAAGDLHDAALNARWLAAARLALDDREGAAAAPEKALGFGRAGPQVPTELAARAELVRLTADGDVDTAEGHLVRCEEILTRGEDWRGTTGQVELARAAVAAARGQHELADTHQARAVEVFTAFGLPWQRASALRSWAGLLTRRGQRQQADERERQADQVLGDIGAADRWRQEVAPP